MSAHYASASSNQESGLFARLTGLFSRRKQDKVEPKYVEVWDAPRGAFRKVDLNDRYDALWPIANEIARAQESIDSAVA